MSPEFRTQAKNLDPGLVSGGPATPHLPFFYDLVVFEKPQEIVILGFGDPQIWSIFCHAIKEHNLPARCIVCARPGEKAGDDPAFKNATESARANFSSVAQFCVIDPLVLANDFADDSVDILLFDDIDRGTQFRAELNVWSPKVRKNGVVLVHGLELEREDALRNAWQELPLEKRELSGGIGLGIGLALSADERSVLRRAVLDNSSRLGQLYSLLSDLAQERAQNRALNRRAAFLETQQVWLESIVQDRRRAQDILEEQVRTIAELERRFAHLENDRLIAQRMLDERVDQFGNLEKRFQQLREDRALAQQMLEERLAQLVSLREDREQAGKLLREQKQIIEDGLQQIAELRTDRMLAQESLDGFAARTSELEQLLAKTNQRLKQLEAALLNAKNACRAKGKCFEPGAKRRRNVAVRVAREIVRVPKNVGKILGREAKPAREVVSSTKAPAPPLDRYASWIRDHEPSNEDLRRQRETAATWKDSPKVSFLIPLFRSNAKYLDELFNSIFSQTNENWEAIVADGGMHDAAARQKLAEWSQRDSRIRVRHLKENFGIAENTNLALELANGDFIAPIDHDDSLSSSACYEMAAAILCEPEADILYSDEDRLSESGQRHSPFFKPEWSPELLLSFMYIGHLTLYRRALVQKLGGFRREFDLSQDYDLVLRASEKARKIVHIPHVLYHWREHAASGAAGGKPHARKTNLAALADAAKRRGFDAEIVEYPTANRLRMRLKNAPRVSVIIPTDSATRAAHCAQVLPKQTDYANAEFVIVTNSRLIGELRTSPMPENVRLVGFDQPFNFSAKCNAGAKAASGSRLIFLNDDVESEQADWIENVIEPLENPEVGAVSPKLLYSTGKIQHAGLVTGVRGLVGTAMHQWPAGSVDYFNYAQSMRNTSALSAACLAMTRDLFFDVGGFDETNTPIAHSDIDLCFKVRAAGRRCVYTPFAALTHHGHASIGEVAPREKKRDRASTYLLQRWSDYTCRDPFFTDNMRDWLYADSPTPIQMFGSANRAAAPAGHNLLIVSHDLSLSGAPIVLAQLAEWCADEKIFLTVMSPADGPARTLFTDAEVPVIIDPLIATGYDAFIKFGRGELKRSHQSFREFARDFDCVIASTVFGAALINDASTESIPCIWWIHEGKVAEHFLKQFPLVAVLLRRADMVIAPDRRTCAALEALSKRPVQLLRYGIKELSLPKKNAERDRVEFLLLGTIEQRKGQLILVEALKKLRPEILAKAQFSIVGRVHQNEIAEEIRRAIAQFPMLQLRGAVSYAESVRLIAQCDVMLSTSSDETGPLTVIEAMMLGKTILATRVGSVGECLVNQRDALLFEPGDARALAHGIERLVSDSKLRKELARNARLAFEENFTPDRFGREFLSRVEDAIKACAPLAASAS